MTVAELLSILEDLDPETEVRLAIQPSWPMQHYVQGAYEVELADGSPVCFIAAGSQPWDAPYLPEGVAEQIEWSR
jgi:hypothetical protein